MRLSVTFVFAALCALKLVAATPVELADRDGDHVVARRGVTVAEAADASPPRRSRPYNDGDDDHDRRPRHRHHNDGDDDHDHHPRPRPQRRPRTCTVTAQPGPMAQMSFSGVQWIWTGEAPPKGVNPIGIRGFRKTIETPRGSCAVCASVIIAADDDYKFHLNGKLIGSGQGWTKGQRYFVSLDADFNTFALEGSNLGGPAAIAAKILVHLADGSTKEFGTDETWRKSDETLPTNWASQNFNERAWGFAQVQGENGVAPWGVTAAPPMLPDMQSQFIWSADVDYRGLQNVGTRYFRKTHMSPGGKKAKCASIIMNVDDSYTLYVNGVEVGKEGNWATVEGYHIPYLRDSSNTFAVEGYNVGGPGGLIATIQITYDDGTFETVRTDTTWKVASQAPASFTQLNYDDSTWSWATDVGTSLLAQGAWPNMRA